MAASSWPVDLDSHFRFLSGIFLAVGVMFDATIPSIERKTFLFRVAASLIVAGGAGRLVSMLTIGIPATPHIVGLVLELVVVPMLVLWQTRVSRGSSAHPSLLR